MLFFGETDMWGRNERARERVTESSGGGVEERYVATI